MGASNKATIDGNFAAAHIAYAFSEVAALYPITPSSTMGEYCDAWASHGQKNVFGEVLDVAEMQSEAGAVGAVHGALSAGSLSTTFTASQGLLLMIPDMYKIAGELLPTVFHVSARAVAVHSLSIFGDHSDVMSVRQTGYALVSACSVQETMDLALVSHLTTLEAKVPFLNFFDGFRTSHEIQKVEMIDYETIKSLIDMKYIEEFRKRALNPERPTVKVAAQNPDVYFQGREAQNKYYEAVPELVQKYMDKVAKKIGRQYHLFDYVGAPDADRIIIAMGSGCDTIEETINYLAKKGEKVGLVKVRLYRPFSVKHFVDIIPKSVKKIAVLDRTKEPGCIGEPLYLDTVAALQGKNIKIIGGRYGLASKEFTPSMVKAVYDHLNGACTHDFTVGIEDDLTNKSLKVKDIIVTEPEDVVRCIFWGLGSDGTVGANKNSIKIIGDYTDMYAQGYFSYDSKKSGGITISYLRFGKSPIQSPYLITKADFVACHNPSYIGRYDMLKELKEGGIFLLNSEYSNDEVFSKLTKDMQETIIKKKLRFYNIDALKIAEEVGLGGRINTVMQAAFFAISGVLEKKKSIELIKKYIEKSYGKKGENVVKMNWAAVDKTEAALSEIKVPSTVTKYFTAPKLIADDAGAFEKKIIEKIMRLQGDDITTSEMNELTIDGIIPTETSKLEKRGIAPQIPKWIPENCIQCNQCSLVCPHAAVRAKQIEPASLKSAPASFKTVKSTTKNEKNLEYKIQVYIEDCTGCGNCVNTCPGRQQQKALEFSPIDVERKAGEDENVKFFDALPDNILDGTLITQFKGTQFKQALFEFSGACAGCGETPYVKLVTQLFGERMIIANATGCSSIYGGTFPTVPYAKSKEGRGPAWGNSLFEDNAEYGYGMRLSINSTRKILKSAIEQLLVIGTTADLSSALKKQLELWTSVEPEATANSVKVKKAAKDTIKSAKGDAAWFTGRIIELEDFLVEKSVWAFGGDGWAYDIGYGGLDHVIAMNKNINILVLDTEVYSNTGGQASKSTPYGSIAKFAEAGKRTAKKDLGLIAMSYGYVYVASIALGANMNQAVKALLEAESFDGPSLILAYAPCINHGLSKGMGYTIEEEKRAVAAGYWPLYRYNPSLAKEGKNPFVYESKDPSADMMEFILSETRYKALQKQFPEVAENLFKLAVEEKQKKHSYYKKLSELQQ
jgi:pyruvate-ferredoxin/flavodoxin oxidoreductase